MKNINMFGWVLIVTITIIVVSSNVSSLGVSPSDLDFGVMDRNDINERTIAVSTGGNETLKLTFSISENMKNWIALEPNETILKGKSQVRIKVKLITPNTAPNGIYNGKIRVSSSPISHTGGSVGTGVSVSIPVDIVVHISDTERYSGNVFSINVKNPIIGNPVSLFVNLMNTGNVRTKPNIHVDILSYDTTNVLKSADYSDTEIDVRENKTIELKISYPEYWNSGKYWANITTSVKDKVIDTMLIEFKILDESMSGVGKLEETTMSTIPEVTPEGQEDLRMASGHKEISYLNTIIISLLILVVLVIIIYAMTKKKEKNEGSPLEKI